MEMLGNCPIGWYLRARAQRLLIQRLLAGTRFGRLGSVAVFFFCIPLKPRVKCMILEYEPASEPLHISVKHLFASEGGTSEPRLSGFRVRDRERDRERESETESETGR